MDWETAKETAKRLGGVITPLPPTHLYKGFQVTLEDGKVLQFLSDVVCYEECGATTEEVARESYYREMDILCPDWEEDLYRWTGVIPARYD